MLREIQNRSVLRPILKQQFLSQDKIFILGSCQTMILALTWSAQNNPEDQPITGTISDGFTQMPAVLQLHDENESSSDSNQDSQSNSDSNETLNNKKHGH